MAGKNKNLQNAKNAKADEFYTSMHDIVSECEHYTDKFRGKIVYCNCDDVFESNFVKYFLMNFNRLGLKELIVSGFPIRPNCNTAYALRVSDLKTDLDEAGIESFLTTERCSPMVGNYSHDGSTYYEAGDFRSDMSIELLKEADIVVTNPMFSLFRLYVDQLMRYEKCFLILGNMNAITYKEFFPLLKDNKVWLGATSGSKEYMTTESYAQKNPGRAYKRGDNYYTKLGNTCWFTNLDYAKRHQMLPLDLNCTYYGHEDLYPRYDNYSAVNVDKVFQIPCDYEPCWYKCPHASECKYAQTEGKEDIALCEQACNGEIGVPISYMDKHCPEQFAIVGNGGSYSGDGSIADELFVPADSCSHNEQGKKKLQRKLYGRIIIRKLP